MNKKILVALVVLTMGIPFLSIGGFAFYLYFQSASANQALEDAREAFRQRDYAFAEDRYTAVIRATPENANWQRQAFLFEVYLERGLTRVEMKKYDDAVVDFTKCLEFDSNSNQAHLHRGKTYYKMGEYVLAERDLSRVFADIEADYYLGLCAERSGDFEKAQDYYERARARPEALASLARILRNLGDDEAAKDCAERARKLKPNVSFEIE